MRTGNVMTEGTAVTRDALRRTTAPALLCARARSLPDRVAFRSKHLGIYRERTWRDYANLVARTAKALAQLGLKAGERVAIMGDVCEEWLICDFAAQSLKAGLGFPMWNPYLFGGMPYVAAMGVGDVFYPTFLLRALLPVDVAMTLGFVIHTVLAGLFMYVFCRAVGLSFIASLIGGFGLGHGWRLVCDRCNAAKWRAYTPAVREQEAGN